MHLTESDEHDVIDINISRKEFEMMLKIFKLCREMKVYKHFPETPTETDIQAFIQVVERILNSHSGWKKCTCNRLSHNG